MKKSTKAVKSVMSGGMFMNSSSSNESNSDEDKCHLPTADSILSDNEKHSHQTTNRVVIRRTLSRLKRQQATTSLQSPLSLRKTSSLESIDDDDDHDHNDLIMSDQIILNDNQQTDENLHRTSFNESERTDSGIGRDSGSSWRLSSYCDSFHPPPHHHHLQQLHQPAREQEQQLDKQQEFDYNEPDQDSSPRSPLNPICHPSEDLIEKNKLQKAGWLHAKHWLTVQRHQKIDLASKRQWKRYWTCLKGSTLFFYNDYSDTNSKFTLSIVESLCYPLPEHPHRQHVFSLTTRFGDTYCFQASDQSELDHWIRNIHCHSSTKTNEFHLKNAIKQIEENIAREHKMRKLADLQLKSSASQKVRLLISKQIDLWEKNLEAYQMDLFRHKCYLCALTNDRELPNPKDLLAQACPATKAALHKLGAFTPCSFYSCITARCRSDRSILKVKSDPKTSTEDSTIKSETKCYLTTPSSPILTTTEANQTILQMVTSDSNPQMKTIVSINESATVGELLKRVTEKLNLHIDDYFLYFDASCPSGFIPNRNSKLNQFNYSSVEIRRKGIYQVTLYDELQSSGIEIETELYREYSLQVIVSNVKKASEGERLGIQSGDEIVMIHGAIVQDLDLNTLDNYLNQIPIFLTIRSSRSMESVDLMHRSLDLSQSIIQNLICPPPPPRRIERLSRQEIRELVVPKPDRLYPNEPKTTESNDTLGKSFDPPGSALERLFKNVDELSRYCRPTTNLCENDNESVALINPTPRIKALSNAQRIRKVIFELVETERSYVQDMQRLLERYIEPLRDDSKLLPTDVIESLYVSVKSIHQLQMTFLERLESNVPTEILAYNAIDEFKDVLISIAETFLSYSQYFKLYSTFCAMHLRINRLLDIHQNNQHLKDFLAARNPRHQHSSSFESYLIKPVQRILKYPLLLQQITNFANAHLDTIDSVPVTLEVQKLKQAITMMNEIGEYMNAMQQLYEDFGQSFEQMIKNYSEERNQTLLLNLPDLYAYGEVDWINIHQYLLRKNYHRLKSYCFVFRHGCLILTREQTNKKKQDLLSIHKGPKINIDRFMRFIPIEELNVELIENEISKENICTWQLIETDPKTRLKTHFRFANKEAQTFVNTIGNCISCSVATVEWRTNTAERSNISIRNSDPLNSSLNSNNEQRIASSRSCHVLLQSNGCSPVDELPSAPARSPSPIWKRRTTPVRKQPLSMNIRRKTMKTSTDC